MPDITSVQPVSGLGNAVRPAPPVIVPPVSSARKAETAPNSTDNQNARDHLAEAEKARATMETRPYDEHILTGPPPTFEASLLEVERDLDATLRRLEARRELGRVAQSGAPPAAPATDEPDDSSVEDGVEAAVLDAAVAPAAPEVAAAPDENSNPSAPT